MAKHFTNLLPWSEKEKKHIQCQLVLIMDKPIFTNLSESVGITVNMSRHKDQANPSRDWPESSSSKWLGLFSLCLSTHFLLSHYIYHEYSSEKLLFMFCCFSFLLSTFMSFFSTYISSSPSTQCTKSIFRKTSQLVTSLTFKFKLHFYLCFWYINTF